MGRIGIGKLGWAALLGVLLLGAGVSWADEPRCGNPESRAFDFWIGEWEVYNGDQLAGTNSVRLILDGCALQEHWAGAKGGKGTSLNYFDPGTRLWHQYWIYDNGTHLDLSGGYADGKMVLEGETKGPEGKAGSDRINWYDNPDGTVRQHWERSTDGGKSWTTVFDGLYKKKP